MILVRQTTAVGHGLIRAINAAVARFPASPGGGRRGVHSMQGYMVNGQANDGYGVGKLILHLGSDDVVDFSQRT